MGASLISRRRWASRKGQAVADSQGKEREGPPLKKQNNKYFFYTLAVFEWRKVQDMFDMGFTLVQT